MKVLLRVRARYEILMKHLLINWKTYRYSTISVSKVHIFSNKGSSIGSTRCAQAAGDRIQNQEHLRQLF